MGKSERTITQQIGLKKIPLLEASNNFVPGSNGINWETSKRKKEQ